MYADEILYAFMEKAKDDPFIGPIHISLYVSLLTFYKKENLKSPISVFRRDVMKQSKIGSRDTYYKCLNDLKMCGYIQYIPSFNPLLGSLVYFLIK
jgi:hypothetical protein